MSVPVVCATLLDQRSIFSLLEDVSQADVAKAQSTFGSVSLLLQPRLDEKWPFNSRFGSSGDIGDPTNDPTFLYHVF